MAPTRPREELYDLMNDPYETVNLADSAAYGEILHQLQVTLDEWIDESNDQGRFPEPPEVIQYYENRSKERYDERIEALRKEWGVE